MEIPKNFNSKNNPPADSSVEATQTDAQSFSNFISHDSPVPADPKEKTEKEREYYDAKENPGRKYNINDQAFSQSSQEDFIPTVSKFHHSDEETGDKGQSTI